MEGKEKMIGENASSSGVAAAEKRNPNKHSALNSAPTGPYAHLMGATGDGGMHGDETCSGKNGKTFHFK